MWRVGVNFTVMNFYTDVIKTDPRFLSTATIRDLSLLEPITRAAVLKLIAAAQAEGITLQVTETYRSQARQELLFAEHKSQLEHVGVHGFGLAADFCKIVDGRASWEGDWSFMVGLCKQVGLVSGVDWGKPAEHHTFVDSDHVQRIAVADQEKLFGGTWYPSEVYQPT
jgi:hypothetical protein